MCYTREDIGHDARCSGCGQTIRLPGRLAAVAVVRSARRGNRAGLAMEIGGFLPMPFFFPWGMILGAAIVYLGWRKSTMLVCSNCNTPLTNRTAGECSGCRSKFSSE
jgi:hypothetical protein